jgi:hypothetical protein
MYFSTYISFQNKDFDTVIRRSCDLEVLPNNWSLSEIVQIMLGHDQVLQCPVSLLSPTLTMEVGADWNGKLRQMILVESVQFAENPRDRRYFHQRNGPSNLTKKLVRWWVLLLVQYNLFKIICMSEWILPLVGSVMRIGGREGHCGRELMASTSSSEDDKSTTHSRSYACQSGYCHWSLRVRLHGPKQLRLFTISFAIWPIRSYTYMLKSWLVGGESGDKHCPI